MILLFLNFSCNQYIKKKRGWASSSSITYQNKRHSLSHRRILFALSDNNSAPSYKWVPLVHRNISSYSTDMVISLWCGHWPSANCMLSHRPSISHLGICRKNDGDNMNGIWLEVHIASSRSLFEENWFMIRFFRKLLQEVIEINNLPFALLNISLGRLWRCMPLRTRWCIRYNPKKCWLKTAYASFTIVRIYSLIESSPARIAAT